MSPSPPPPPPPPPQEMPPDEIISRALPEKGPCGYALVELYSIVMDETQGNHILQDVQITAEDVEGSQVVYSGPIKDTGIPLTLTGPNHPLIAHLPFQFTISLGGGKDKHILACAPTSDNSMDVVKTQLAECPGIGKATFTYGITSPAIEAQVRVSFIPLGKNRDIYPTHFGGQIYATHDMRPETQMILYNTPLDEDSNNAHLLQRGYIPLLRSALVAQLDSYLDVQFDLNALYDDPTYDEHLQYICGWQPPSRKRHKTWSFNYSDRIQVQIFWKVPNHFAGTSQMDFVPVSYPAWEEIIISMSRKMKAARAAEEASEMLEEAKKDLIASEEGYADAIKWAEEARKERDALKAAAAAADDIARAEEEVREEESIIDAELRGIDFCKRVLAEAEKEAEATAKEAKEAAEEAKVKVGRRATATNP